MNKQLKRVLTYVKMTLLFTVLGGVVLYIAGKPLADYAISHGNMIIVKGAPGYPNENNPDTSKLTLNKNSTTDKSEIQIPALETQFGMISCERIELTAPVYYGDSDYVLQNGVGQSASGAFPGEGKPILISGHDSTFFAPLQNIEIGDLISITTEYGSFVYKVSATKIKDAADATAVDLTVDKEQLILYTCYPFGGLLGDRSDRFFVYCDLVSGGIEAAE